MKTADYCDICKRDMCEDCVADATNPYCVPSHYEIRHEPKTEDVYPCDTCKWDCDKDVCGRCRDGNLYAPRKDKVKTCDNCKYRKSCNEAVFAYRGFTVRCLGYAPDDEPKDEPQNHSGEVTEMVEPKQGEWEWNQYDGNPAIGNYHCSICGWLVPHDKYAYCPNCGAKMSNGITSSVI